MATSSMRPFTVWSCKLSIILFLSSMRGQHGFLVGTAPREMHGIDKKFMALHHARPELSCFSSYSNRKNILPITRDVSFALHNSAGDQITSLPTSDDGKKTQLGIFGKFFVHLGKILKSVGTILWSTCWNNFLVKVFAAKVIWLMRTTELLKSAVLDSKQPLSSPQPQVLRHKIDAHRLIRHGS
jgi:hypothetical protein